MRQDRSLTIVAFALASVALSAQAPQFRSTVTGVGVPVVVKSGGTPVRDLTSSDFVLMDNGVEQEIVAVDGTSMPLDITVVAQENLRLAGLSFSNFEAETAAVEKAMRPVDRFTVVFAGRDQRTFAPPGTEIQREQGKFEQRCVPVYDALVRVLMSPTAPDRQKVIVLLTVGEGEGGFTSTQPAVEIARRSNARLYVVGLEPNAENSGRSYIAWGKCPETSVDWSPDRQPRLRQIDRLGAFDGWRQLWIDGKNRLVEIANMTGGREIHPTILRQDTVGPIREALDEARASYILRYTPKGVPEPGWHPITVKVNKPGRYDIRVRPGYER
jgi:hypothetical protein